MLIPARDVELEAVLWEPEGQVPRGAVLLCHPHPLYGGTMNSRVVYRAAKGAVEAGLSAMRFNFRGVGASTGSHDKGRGEQSDIQSLLEWLQERYPQLPLAIIGYSFGAWVGLRAARHDPRLKALVGLGLPIDAYDFGFLQENDIPSLFIIGTRDEFCPDQAMRLLAARLPSTSSVRWIEGADHSFSGHIDQVQTLVRNFLQAQFEGSPT